MDRFAGVVERVAYWFVAKERPQDEFAGAFWDLREKAKALKEKWSQEAKERLAKGLRSELEEAGLKVESVELSLGKYKGSRFVTSGKVRVEMPSEAKAKGLVEKLQKWSPKYIFKSYVDGVAEYNIR